MALTSMELANLVDELGKAYKSTTSDEGGPVIGQMMESLGQIIGQPQEWTAERFRNEFYLCSSGEGELQGACSDRCGQ